MKNCDRRRVSAKNPMKKQSAILAQVGKSIKIVSGLDVIKTFP